MQSRFIHEGDIQDFAKDGHKLFHVIVDKEAKKEEDDDAMSFFAKLAQE